MKWNVTLFTLENSCYLELELGNEEWLCWSTCFSSDCLSSLSVSVTLTLSSVHPSIYPSSCLSLPICLYLIYPSTHLSVCPSVYISVDYQSIWPSFYLSIFLSTHCLSIHPSIHLPTLLYVYLWCPVIYYYMINSILLLLWCFHHSWFGQWGPLQEVCCVLCHMRRVHLI